MLRVRLSPVAISKPLELSDESSTMIATIAQEANETMSAFQKYLCEFFDRPGSPPQAVIAERAGISRENLNRIIKGHQRPALDKAEAIALATGTTLGRILKKSERRELISA